MIIGIKSPVLKLVAENEVGSPEYRRGYLGIKPFQHVDDKPAILAVALHLVKPTAEHIGHRPVVLQLVGVFGENSIESPHQRRQIGKSQHLLGVAPIAGKDISVFAGVFNSPPSPDVPTCK
ncbi:hypothetical protein ES703_81726 [subsurface metagenome]